MLAASAVLVTLMTWPLVPRLGSVGRLDTGDGRFSIWNVGWVAHALLTDPRHLLDANIFWPHRGTLAYSEMNLVAGVLGLPVYALTHNALAAHNAAVVEALVLCLVLTWLLVRRLTRSSGAGYVSAILFTFCSFIWGHTAHVQLLMTFALPLVLLAFHRLRDKPTVTSSILLGLSLAVAALASGYFGLYGGVFLAFLALTLGRRELRYWTALAGAAAVAAAVLVPVAVPYMRARAVPGIEQIRGNVGLQISADVQDYVTAPTMLESALVHWHWSAFPHESLSPGLVMPLLVIAAFVSVGTSAARQRSAAAVPTGGREDLRLVIGYLVATALIVWASLGPSFGLYALLMRALPGMALVRAPARMGVLVALGLAVIAGFGTRWLTAQRRWVILGLVAVAAVDRFSIWPWFDAGPMPGVYRVLATLPPGVVVDFPFAYEQNDFHRHTRAMYYSTTDWMPRVNGYSDLIPTDFVDIAIPINSFPEISSFALMHRYSVRYAVWQMAGFKADPEAMARLEQRFKDAAPYLRPIARDDDFWLYEIVGWPPGA